MVRNYKRKAGSRRYRDYSQAKLDEAVEAVRNGMKFSAAEVVFGIPRRTIANKFHGKHKNVYGHQKVYSDEEEQSFVQACITMCDWGFPVGRLGLANLVYAYNIKMKRNILEFKDNKPGRDWIDLFLKRHPDLSLRFDSNIKASRAAITREIMEKYFENLQNSIDGMPPENIFNYDETCFTDDPGKRKVIAPRGRKYVEQVLNATKSSVSVMFCGSANGILLPPYICYKSEYLWSNWQKNQPKGDPFCTCPSCKFGVRINRSRSGWFDGVVFVDWFKMSFLPHAKRLPGKKALIGDNLASHVSQEVISLAVEHQILLIFLPPNSTHLTQPLDISFFRPVKSRWRPIITSFKIANPSANAVDKVNFPILLGQTFQATDLRQKCPLNLIKGFEKAGIYPLNRDKVISRIPNGDESSNSSLALSDAVMEHLSQLRHHAKNSTKSRGKRLQIPPGQSVGEMELDDQPGTSGIQLTTQRRGRGGYRGRGRGRGVRGVRLNEPSSDSDSEESENSEETSTDDAASGEEDDLMENNCPRDIMDFGDSDGSDNL